ncbi:MAG TPA: MoxR family ATPase [Actinomycetota bacterium]|nr:MoxR family ATPase [Actinomycetota bacterium]
MARAAASKNVYDAFARFFEKIQSNVEQVIQGKPDVVRLSVLALVAEGHLLVEDVPGVGKTMLAKALARSLGCSFRRIQFTPDLLPTDITGVRIWTRDKRETEFRPGPIFAQIVLGDEINRASPKTQAALLESMEERQVTLDGQTMDLERPFMVIATQNPIEHEGTYPLPEAELDRFLMRVKVGYPTPEAEVEVLSVHGSPGRLDEVEPVAKAGDVVKLIDIATSVHVADSVKAYIVNILNATRNHPDSQLGASPRAGLMLMRASRALAAAEGREYVVPDDVKQLATPVLAHRIILTPEAQLGGGAQEDVIADALSSTAVPTKARRG